MECKRNSERYLKLASVEVKSCMIFEVFKLLSELKASDWTEGVAAYEVRR